MAFTDIQSAVQFCLDVQYQVGCSTSELGCSNYGSTSEFMSAATLSSLLPVLHPPPSRRLNTRMSFHITHHTSNITQNAKRFLIAHATPLVNL